MTAMRRRMMMTCFPSEQSVTDCSRIHRWTQRSFGEPGLQRQVVQEERSGGTFYPSYISFTSYLLDEDHCGVCVQLKTRQGCEYLMQYDKESIISDWLKVIQDTIGHLGPDGAHRPVILRTSCLVQALCFWANWLTVTSVFRNRSTYQTVKTMVLQTKRTKTGDRYVSLWTLTISNICADSAWWRSEALKAQEMSTGWPWAETCYQLVFLMSFQNEPQSDGISLLIRTFY